MNNPPFHIGQRVVCVSAPGSLVLGKVYTVHEIRYCYKCKVWWVGHTLDTDKYPNDKWPCCGKLVTDSDNIRYRLARARRFAPISERSVEIGSAILEQAEEMIGVQEVQAPVRETVNN